MQLKPGLRPLWRSQTSAQVGAGPELTVVLRDISPCEHDLLAALERPQTLADLRRRARAKCGRPAVADALVRRLREAGALAADDDAAPTLSAPARRHLEPDARAWSLLRDDGAGWRHLEARAAARVTMMSLDPVGLAIAMALASAGIGHLSLADKTPISPAELHLGGYGPRDTGVPRNEAAARLVQACGPDTLTSLGQEAGDVAVVVDWDVLDPVRSRDLVRRDLVHLPVLLNTTAAQIGPLTLPGSGPCPHCLELYRSDRDASWPAVATQLRVRQTFARRPETMLGLATAALAANEVLAWVDGIEPLTHGATLDIALPHLIARRRLWGVHAQCGCQGPLKIEQAEAAATDTTS